MDQPVSFSGNTDKIVPRSHNPFCISGTGVQPWAQLWLPREALGAPHTPTRGRAPPLI